MNKLLGQAVLVLLILSASQALAGEVKLDTLLVGGAPSPCLAVHVNVIQKGRSLAQLNLGPTGTIKLTKGEMVHFQKGQTYLLQANCISTTARQQSGLTFTADGRTIIVQFTDQGYQIKRGGVAY